MCLGITGFRMAPVWSANYNLLITNDLQADPNSLVEPLGSTRKARLKIAVDDDIVVT